MLFKEHSNLEGTHAILAPSKPSWLNYTDEQIIESLRRQKASQIGTVLHSLAAKMITERIRLLKQDKHLVLLYLLDNNIPRYVIDVERIMETLIPYVNDAIGFRMYAEKLLYYSDCCFGTVDAIVYQQKTKTLRIHDLKTGVTPTRVEQLEIYAALYLLEYKLEERPENIELRVYQNGVVESFTPSIDRIEDIVDWIKTASNVIGEFEERQRR